MDKLDFGYYNMDCMAGMKLFPDKYFDVAIVDPPYGINAPNMAMGTNKSRLRDEVKCCYCGYINHVGKYTGRRKRLG